MTPSNPTCGDCRETLQNILTEAEVLKILGLNKLQLGILRTSQKLPFLKVNRNCRLYLERDLVEWLKAQRTVTNSAS